MSEAAAPPRALDALAGKRAVVLLSGGLDSATCLAMAHAAGARVLALTIDYNQRHRRELAAAANLATRFGVERHIRLPLDLRAFGGSALTDAIDVPKDGVGPGIPITYVPARNTVFLSVALAWAEAADASDLVIGVNALDYSGYPDCRPEFVAAFEDMANLATKAGVEGSARYRIHTPLLHLTKAGIVEAGAALGLDFARTWSCYDPAPGDGGVGSPEDVRHCGLCDSCRLRKKGFLEAGIPDPTDYAA
ncbi:MAG: 7-cyano-7-deazaguanine synthase QueC [Thermaurantiacus sp.]